jgi:F0F1-type ATP synthase delta subunit
MLMVRTKSDLDLLRDEIKLLKDSLFRVEKGNFDEVLETIVRASVAKKIRQDLVQNVEKESYLNDLDLMLSKIKVVKLTLAVEPTERMVDNLSNWIRKNLGDGVILDFDYNRALIGGAMVVYQGKFGDYSLANYFEKKSDEEKKFIFSILKSGK